VLLAAEWNFGDVLLLSLFLFFWVVFIWMFIVVFADILSRHDLSGWVKAVWIIFIVFLPFLGVLVYVIARPPGLIGRGGAAASLPV
jgi:Phospholipase_D-nuclease N-terminal